MDVSNRYPHSNHVAKFLPKRLRKPVRDNIQGVTKPAIRRLARRGGVVRIQAGIYTTVREVLVARLQLILEKLVHLLESSDTHRRARKTVTTRDVVFVLKSIGRPVYGFDGNDY